MKNKIIRVCAQRDPKLENFAIIRGVMVITINDKNNFAYGAGYKAQGGGSWGDYHIIGALQEDSSWKFNVGLFQPFDGYYDEYAETASKISDNFNSDDAKKYFEDYNDGSMYNLSKKFQITNCPTFVSAWDIILKNCSAKEKQLFDFDEEGYPNEQGKFYFSKLCKLTDLDEYEEHAGYLWYSNDECEDILIDLEDEIPNISSLIPGKIHFMRQGEL